jgi:signal transduction histidine kinase
VARPAIGGGVLWLETQGPHRFSEETISELVVALDHLDHLAPLRRLGADARRLTRMGEWAGGVAHDLRNKLNLALLASHKLKAEGGIEGRELQVALEGAVELCQDFLREGAARQTEGQLLSDVIQAEAKAAAHLSGRNGLVRVEAKCSADLTVPSDGSRLRRVLSNLILNAIAASPPKGCVRIQAQRESGGGVELTVEDRGRGMSRGELQRFLRAGQSRTGTGFGTASVLTCVEELGAELHVESERSVGTRICLRLPGSVRRDGEMAIDRAV